MGSINEEGFLSEEISLWISKIRNDFSEWFTLCDDISRFSQQLIQSEEVKKDNKVELLASCLFVRALSNFQGIILMAERGMINEAKILTRCLVECMYVIVAIDKDNNFSDVFILDDLYKQKEKLKGAKRIKISGILPETGLGISEIEEGIQNLEKKIKLKSVNWLAKKNIAKKAEMGNHYDTVYIRLSDTVHVNSRDLEQYLNFSKDNTVQELKWGPDVEGIELTLFAAVDTLSNVLIALSRILDLDYRSPWERIVDQLEKLSTAF